MHIYDYQKEAYASIKPHDSADMEKADWALGLAGEVGEVIELVKHNIMHREPLDLGELAKEISDVLWYCAALATSYGLNLDTIAELNIAKLRHRHGQGYSRQGSQDRHQKEVKFTETELYKELVSKLELRYNISREEELNV